MAKLERAFSRDRGLYSTIASSDPIGLDTSMPLKIEEQRTNHENCYT